MKSVYICIIRAISIVSGLITCWVAIYGQSTVAVIFLVLGLIAVIGNIFGIIKPIAGNALIKCVILVSLVTGIWNFSGGVSQMSEHLVFGIVLIGVGAITAIGNLGLLFRKG